MRVLLLSDVYFPRITGVCTALQTYRAQLAHMGVETHLIAPAYGKGCEEPGITRLSSRPVPFDREDHLIRPSLFKTTAIRMARDFDVIHIHTPFSAHGAGLAAARKHGLPVLATYHTLFEEYLHLYAKFLPRAFTRTLARRLSRRQCNQMDGVIVPSTAMAQRLKDYGVSSPLHVLPTGIPVERFTGGDRRRFRASQGISPERTVALFLGRMAHEKNLHFLLEAFRQALAECPDLLLILAGEGPAELEIRAQAAAWGMNTSVRFLGNMDRVLALPDCLAGADFFTFASLTETQGLVLLEAMAAGLPVVALGEMGTLDILKPESGAKVPPNDARAFAMAMAEVARNAELRQSMSEASRAWASRWSDRSLTQRLADLYQLVGMRGDRPGQPLMANPLVQ
ncbi:glycosyltransferase [Holophaga foetida]|uniref:glycosyltransferase n=1 Tax=Holophaga foetida TaxID=35839 RepID=UPI0002473737|nr:glycosyltransferase [Holophaga foetida]